MKGSRESVSPAELRLYDNIVKRVNNLPEVDLVLENVDDSTLAHFIMRELNLLRDGRDLADREVHLGTDATMEQALGIAAVQMLKNVIKDRNTSPTAVQEALQSLARNRLAVIASARTSTEWLLP